eukprot:Hpha_TRINITY_DN15909_c1_g2::TRINITY_DN15909_c1_g2_i2::g.72658::m.72658/K19882/NOTUM; O-palmitoleoyl-L-serine hydrolase
MLLLGGSSQLPPMTHKSVSPEIGGRFGAKCLDGSLPTYEIRRNTSSSGWVLFLEGGGWCNGPTPNATIDNCAARAGFAPPSGSGNAAGVVGTADYGGIMGADPQTNPGFSSWNAAFIHYCDGSSFGGGRVDPVAVKTKAGAPAQMWLRGRANFEAVVTQLMEEEGMGKGEEVILSGGSAGGLAVFYNVDHLAGMLGAGVKLTGFPDAGFFLDYPNVATGKHDYRQNFIGADPIWNVTASGGTNLKCLQHYKGEEWKCLLAPYLMPFIETRMFIMNSAFDAYQLPTIAGNKCYPTPQNPCNASVAVTFGAVYKAAVAAAVVKPEDGYYIDGCVVHETNVNYCSTQNAWPNCVGWTADSSGSVKWNYTVTVAGESPQAAFYRYYHGGETVRLIDDGAFQQNPRCIYYGPKAA